MENSIEPRTLTTDARQFNCAGCGASLSVVNPRAKYIACQYCGSVLDANSEEHQILQTLGKPEKHQPFSFIQLGQSANFKGKEYMVIARTRWRMRYKEYYNEEGEKGYSNEVWIYDEWLMIDSNRTYFYLIEDKEGYWISEEIIPETPTLLTNDLRMSFYQNQSKKIVKEYGKAEVIHFEGETNYEIKKGDQVRFASFSDRGIDFQVEWRMKNETEVKEVEFFREVPISRRKVIEAFNNNEEIEKLKEKESFWRFVYKVAGFSTLAMLVMILYAFISNGQQVGEAQEFALSGFMADSSVLSAPIQLSETGNYSLEISCSNLSNNSEFYIMGFILDEDQAAINEVDGTFYYYTGFDDEGQWTEKDLKTRRRFRIEEAGTIYVQMYLDTQQSIGQGYATIKLYRGVMMARYFVIVFIISLITAIVARTRFK